MDNQKLGVKKSLLMILGIFSLALISIFGIYYYYKMSINPEYYQEQKNEQVTTNDEDIEYDEKNNSLLIGDYSQDKIPESVFDRDLAIREALEGTSGFVSKGELEFTPELCNTYKDAILRALYFDEYKKAVDYAYEVINNYDLESEEYSFKEFQTFVYEVIYFSDYKNASFEDKEGLLASLNSPELILFSYLRMSLSEQNSIIKNKNADVILDNSFYGSNLIYNGSTTCGIYSEMRINDAYFVVPDNIEGYKIGFQINNVNYMLYYIKYLDNNKTEIISVENLDDMYNISFKEYFNIY